MLASDVTTSAFSDNTSSCSRTARCRRSSASLGACDMNGGEPRLERGENRTHPGVLALIGGLRNRFRKFSDRALEFRIIRRQLKRRCVELLRVRRIAASAVHVAESTKGRQVLRRTLKNHVQFLLSFVELIQLEERATEGHPRGQITGMLGETPPADLNRFFMPAEAAALFSELRKSNRRRILFDPASKIFQSLVFRHAAPSEGRGYLEVPPAPTTIVL